MLIIDNDKRKLARISDRLSLDKIPHIVVVGSIAQPYELLRAIYRSGVQDVDEFLFIQSLVSLNKVFNALSVETHVWHVGSSIPR